KVSGQTYDDYVRKNIFDPAGMKNTGAIEKDTPTAGRALGYTRGDDGSAASGPWRRNTESLPGKGGSAGGGYSTVEDLLRFDVALRSHRLLNAEYTNLVLTGKVDMGPGMQYGYGFG